MSAVTNNLPDKVAGTQDADTPAIESPPDPSAVTVGTRRIPRWRRYVAIALIALTPVVWLVVAVSALLGRIDNTVGFQSAALAGFVLLAAIVPLAAIALLVPRRGPGPVVAAVLVPAIGLSLAALLFNADKKLRSEVVMPWTCGAAAESALADLEGEVDGTGTAFESGGYWQAGNCTGNGWITVSQAEVVQRATAFLTPQGAISSSTDDQGTITITGVGASGQHVTVTVLVADPELGGTGVELAVDDPHA